MNNDNRNLIVAIDDSGRTKEALDTPHQSAYYQFILCTRGECHMEIYMAKYRLRQYSIVTVLPNSYIHILEQSDDCELYILAFKAGILSNINSFSSIIDYVPSILSSPLVTLSDQATELIKDYVKLIMRAEEINPFGISSQIANSMLLTIIHSIGPLYNSSDNFSKATSRAREIVKQFIHLMSQYYTSQRSPSFYANKLHITPQHLSSVVNSVTGMRVIDIIAKLVVVEAQTKLRSTDMTIEQIAYSLNFSDISVFGKYFKRYTGVSPRHYRGHS